MRNVHEVHGWKLTPAIGRSTYEGKEETMAVTKVNCGRDGDGYHVESPQGLTYFVQFWDTDRRWTSQKLVGETPSMWLENSSKTLKGILETLRFLACKRTAS
jgi:hypothetical protein